MSRPLAQRTGPDVTWSGRVLTWEDVRPFLGELRELTIGLKTIVSPLVLDELKARKITVRRGEGSSATATERVKKSGIGVALERPDGIVTSVVQGLRKEGVSLLDWSPKGESLAGWAWSLGLLVKESATSGVAFASDASLVACVAGKVAGVRAARVLTGLEVTRAINGFGANLLSVDVPGRSFFEIKQILRAAATSVSRWPAEVEKVFREVDSHAHR
jgi:hypothetical protein